MKILLSDNRATNLCSGLCTDCFCLRGQWHGINVLTGVVGEKQNIVK